MSPARGMAIFGLFLVPFAAVGLAIGAGGIWRMAQGNWREGLLQLLFGAAFAGFAAAGTALMTLGRRKLRELEQLQAMHPGQPWLWRRDWAGGLIQDSGRSMVWVAWIFGVFWNLVSAPIGLVGVRTALQQGNPKLFLVLLFPFVGLGLLVWAVRLTLRNLKYGPSWLELSSIPGPIGGTMAGTVRIPCSLQPDDGFEATLSCFRRVTTRSGRNSSTSERLLWQEESRVRGTPVRDTAGSAMRVPVTFRIPGDAAATDSSNPRDQIVWRLSVGASVPGVDYHTSFEVPVFRTGETSSAPPATQPDELQAAYRQPPSSRITVTRTQRGTEIYFPAARNPGVAVSATIFTILWVALLFALVSWDAPLLFPIVFGLFALLFVAGVLQTWLGVSRVQAERAAVSVASGYVLPGRERRIDAAQVANVAIKIGMQAGTTPYYDVVVVRKDGKRVIAGRAVQDKREAEWLAWTLRTAVGLREPEVSANSWPLLQA